LIQRFTYNNFESGGRLWGGFWINLKRYQRPMLLRIKREKTVEVDYAGILPRLAYGSLKVSPPTGDVYAIPGLSSKSRTGIKVLLNALLMERRSKPRDRFPQGVSEKFAPEDRIT
jgi:hypothetical protein